MLACTDEKYLQAIHINVMSFNSKNKSLKKTANRQCNIIWLCYPLWLYMREICCNLNHYNALSVCERILQDLMQKKKKIISPDMIQLQFTVHIYICVSFASCIFEKPFAILYLKVSYLSNNKHFFFTFSIAKTLYFVQIFEHAIRRQIYTQFPAIEVLHLCTYLSALAYIIRVIDIIF